MSRPPLFAYDPALVERFPAARAGIVHAAGVENGPSPEALIRRLRAEHEAAAELPSIAAWRRAFTAFGAKPTQYRNAAEALLRRLGKQGSIPPDQPPRRHRQHRLDPARAPGRRLRPLEATAAAGRALRGRHRAVRRPRRQRRRPAGARRGRLVDASGAWAARRWCWRQSATSAVDDATTDVLLVVEAVHDDADGDVEAALGDLTRLLADAQPSATLDASRCR